MITRLMYKYDKPDDILPKSNGVSLEYNDKILEGNVYEFVLEIEKACR